MTGLSVIVRRELYGYFATPVAYVFTVIFLVLSGVFTFYLGHFFERGQADLLSFFNFLPWLYLVLIPAVSMRLWSEERRSGTIELLLTLPVSIGTSVLGKFLAAWFFVGVALALTFPLWITVNYLGHPDNGVISATYIGAWLMAGGFLAIGSCLSAATRNQVIAFILTLVVCFLFVVTGFPMVQDLFTPWAPTWVIDGLSALSFLGHFDAIARGVIELRDLLYFLLTIVTWLLATVIVLNLRKAN
ncbi:ABC transporter permease subunit [Mangrovitalea sediminis]|uniref:ABC transporter permease subunit n=1 Tax=Mangrovitalea sediminis TaxID=1982043 RepID=UPI000BE59DAB|nr:ABC transporter permease subunit [Mangrovitalea sediminis]